MPISAVGTILRIDDCREIREEFNIKHRFYCDRSSGFPSLSQDSSSKGS
jgi:hypothetical protein